MNYLNLLRSQFNNHIAFRERRPGILQLIIPCYHEDGDMVEIFLEPSPEREGSIRICDYGMTLMRLSYSYELDTPRKEQILARILSENYLNEDDGNLYLDAKPDALYPAVLQFAQTVAKVANMRIYQKEVIRSLFYEMLREFVEKELKRYKPQPRQLPIPSREDLEVDYLFEVQPHPIFLFGVQGDAKARLVAIACLEFQRAKTGFKSFVVHEDFEDISRKDRKRITSAADKQFVSLDDFKQNAIEVFEREVA
jgi:Domain of unknown function DUF1828